MPFSFSYELPCPCWFPLVGVLLKECLYQLLWFCHVMIFMVFWNCSHLFRFLDFLDRSPPGSKVCRVFIKFYISTDVSILESWEVYLIGLLCIIVSYEYTLLPRKIELGHFLLWDMYVHRASKYSQMTDFWFFSRESLFKSIIIKWMSSGFSPKRSFLGVLLSSTR